MTITTIEKVKKGDFFMLTTAKTISDSTVYSAEGYCRETKKYCGTKQSDFCHQVYKKKGTKVFIGFEY